MAVQFIQFRLDGCDRSIRPASVHGISLVNTLLYAIQHTVIHTFLGQCIDETLVTNELRHQRITHGIDDRFHDAFIISYDVGNRRLHDAILSWHRWRCCTREIGFCGFDVTGGCWFAIFRRPMVAT